MESIGRQEQIDIVVVSFIFLEFNWYLAMSIYSGLLQ